MDVRCELPDDAGVRVEDRSGVKPGRGRGGYSEENLRTRHGRTTRGEGRKASLAEIRRCE